jgi:hypothetical protein
MRQPTIHQMREENSSRKTQGSRNVSISFDGRNHSVTPWYIQLASKKTGNEI